MGSGWVLAVALVGCIPAWGQADPLRGLWVGEATLNYVNEVSVPLDENNQPVAPVSRATTPTADRAQLRLLLHVNGAGQTALLKEVAVLNRRPESGVGVAGEAVESDLALVTDPRLYGAFPPQPAVRWASAVFDFGDHRATVAVDEMVGRVAPAVAAVVAGASAASLQTELGRRAVEAAAAQAGLTAAEDVPVEADVATAFDGFVRQTLTSALVNTIAVAADPAAAAAAVRTTAVQLQNGSFYGDSRAVALVDAVVGAANEGGTPAERQMRAQEVAGSYADTVDFYHRFLAGKVFGDMLFGASAAAARAAVEPAPTEASLRLAVNGDAAVVAARNEALNLRVNGPYVDTRGQVAVAAVLDAIVLTALAASAGETVLEPLVREEALAAGRGALEFEVARYPVSALRPTTDYTNFVRSSAFGDSLRVAANAAGIAAVSERVNNPLYTSDSLVNAARVGAVTALQSVYATAARALRTELPLAGLFGPGSGDARLTQAVLANNASSLGPAGLSGEVILPANHPTNPFRHRRHPDHGVGFDVRRLVRLDFDGSPGDPLRPAGFGVTRITGVYREEIFGLHKPLGPNRDIGLRVEGRFELRRVSSLDALNAQ
jgi:hypothetical protein